ncbi:MAG TPA: SDR family NAD(P)-dependent oxidoreductase [Chloroflexota bacterium]|nr:SDR family NAD(P)-dependent oxidoreductase [Chloroflexota bacterium]
MDLKGKSAIVTGGGTGIGRAISLELARQGVAVVVNYSRSEGDARDTVARIQDLGERAMAVKADVGSEDEVRAMVAAAADAFGGVDLLVNNAGVTRYIPLADLESVTDEAWQSILSVNLLGAFRCARAMAPSMQARGGGAIVNVSSVAGFSGDGSSLPYAVSKAALNGLTRSLAKALAPTIRVTAVAPGIVRTRWVAGKDEHVDRLSKAALLKRTADADDVARLVCFLLAQDSITGEIVRVDGGLLS